VGDEVLLSTKNLKAKQPSKKLTHYFIGQYCVEKIIGRPAYKLTLPTAYQIHSIFYVSLLEPYVCRRGANIPKPFLPPVIVDDKEEYVVEELLEKKTEKGQVWFLVHWEDWPKEYNKWVKEEDLHAPALCCNFEAKANRWQGKRTKHG